MKKVKLLAFFGAIIINIASCNRASDYINEDLLFRYIDDHQKNRINEKDYNLVFLCTKNLCSSCYKISLGSVYHTIIDTSNTIPLYFIFDDVEFSIEMAKKFPSKAHHLVDINTSFDQYGITNVNPLYFHIRDNSVLNWKKIRR